MVYSENIDEMSDEGDYEAVEEEEDEDGIEDEEIEAESEEDAPAADGKCFKDLIACLT